MKAGFQYMVNPLIGCNWTVLKEIENRFSVDPEFRHKYNRSKALSRILHELARFDRMRYRSMRQSETTGSPPVFIIGHWRSGTSFLHTLLCRVYPAAFTTTYHSVFPNNLFAFQGLVKFFMRIFMPSNRPTDAMKMHPDFPQEEELALGHAWFFSFYYWFYFPRQAASIVNEFLNLNNPGSKISREFRKNYMEYISRCKLNTGGDVFISKNPANTFRMEILRDMFPNARFIYLKRDPYETIESSQIFFRSLIQGISLQVCEDEKVDRFVLENYMRLVNHYMDNRQFIPSRHLIELSYEELIKNPAETLSQVTRQLDLPVTPDLSKTTDYLESNNDFPVKKYQFSDKYISDVNNTLGDLIELQGYRIRNNGQRVRK